MHISEGILTGKSMAASLAGGALALGWGLTRMQAFVKAKPQRKPLLSMAGAFVFLVSLMPFPALPGTTTHPCGTPLAAILLGPGVTVVLAGLSLLLQAAFFAHGGFSSLGANTLTLGLAGGLAGWGVYHLGRRLGLSRLAAGMLAGFLGDIVVYAAAGLMLGTHLAFFVEPQHLPTPLSQLTSVPETHDFLGWLKLIYMLYLPVQTPLAIGEALITGWALHAIGRQRPEVLEDLGVEKPRLSKPAGAALLLLALLPLAAGLGAAQPLVDGASPAKTAPAAAADPTAVSAATQPDYVGMDEKVNEALAARAGSPAREPYLNTEKMGDLWNLILLAGGATAGFIVGRHWHRLFGEAGSRSQHPGT